MSSENFYDILGLSPKADEEQIKAAYRLACKRYHPDSNPGFEEEFRAAQEAYDVLSNPADRARYDRNLQTQESPSSSSHSAASESRTNSSAAPNRPKEDADRRISKVGRLEFLAPAGEAWDRLSAAQREKFFGMRFQFPSETEYDINFERRSLEALKKYENFFLHDASISAFGEDFSVLCILDARNLQRALLEDCQQFRIRELGFSSLQELHAHDNKLSARMAAQVTKLREDKLSEQEKKKKTERFANLSTVFSLLLLAGMYFSRPSSDAFRKAVEISNDSGLFSSGTSLTTLGGLLPFDMHNSTFLTVVGAGLALNLLAILVITQLVKKSSTHVMSRVCKVALSVLAVAALVASVPLLVVSAYLLLILSALGLISWLIYAVAFK